jgi:3',5'-cyclic AMP phosphodiesterase CpdA
MASGFFGDSQAERLAGLLDKAHERGLCRVIMIHHPPVRGAAAAHKRLFGIGRFHKVMRRHGAELVLHGHTHLPTVYRIRGRDGIVPVVGVAAAGQAPGGERPPGQYNLLEIDGEPGAWRVGLQRHGLSARSSKVEMIEEKLLTAGMADAG